MNTFSYYKKLINTLLINKLLKYDILFAKFDLDECK
jgi:hypothetical protein